MMELTFRKSSYSGEGGQCVEIADLISNVVVRDSKVPDGPTLVFPRDEFVAFLRGLKVSVHG
ncbi:hypothetical protein GCM10009677_21890 [Sphaerisporangium rubeum]|uniref:DUF397 domain-containing protein n=1 Tax=Sphaerisporangium rubeum TaxID=321317 RepID=A0A7X0IAN6_9ACTN|nr:DUF397 domain-containing protein [Sphaerisporangium rubeum]MBB6471706.1 hypothetical protein [Sphaerisporangium rubeum]